MQTLTRVRKPGLQIGLEGVKSVASSAPLRELGVLNSLGLALCLHLVALMKKHETPLVEIVRPLSAHLYSCIVPLAPGPSDTK